MQTIIAIVLLVLSLGSSQVMVASSLDSLPQSRLPDGGFVIGYPDAPVTIIEFGDFACPHCQNYLPIINQFINTYVKIGKAKFEFRILPTAGGELTFFIGTVLVCMDDQKAGTFWQGYTLLYEAAIDGTYDGNTMRKLAKELGVNYTDALNCAQNEQQVYTDFALAQDLDVGGTPAIRVRDAKGEADLLIVDGEAYDTGGPSFDVLSKYMAQFQ